MYKGNMTKDEAFEAMKAGKKVCREGFSTGEYLWMDHFKIKSEEGYNFIKWWREIEPTMHKEDENTFYLYNEERHG